MLHDTLHHAAHGLVMLDWAHNDLRQAQQGPKPGQLEFPEGAGLDFDWSHSTSDIKDLIRRLLTRDPAARITPEQVQSYSAGQVVLCNLAVSLYVH